MFFKTLGKTFVSSGLTNSTERYREREIRSGRIFEVFEAQFGMSTC